jgi:crossover junction endodeoxyribonuclease RuvC
MTCCIGIDPGFSGAVAFYWPAANKLEIHDMPTLMGNTGKRDYDWHLLNDLLTGDPGPVVLELVTARPGIPAKSLAVLRDCRGAVMTLAAASQRRVYEIDPSRWKRNVDIKLPKGATAAEKRDASLKAALDRFPAYSDLFRRKKDDGRADAALLAFQGVHSMEVLKCS